MSISAEYAAADAAADAANATANAAESSAVSVITALETTDDMDEVKAHGGAHGGENGGENGSKPNGSKIDLGEFTEGTGIMGDDLEEDEEMNALFPVDSGAGENTVETIPGAPTE